MSTAPDLVIPLPSFRRPAGSGDPALPTEPAPEQGESADPTATAGPLSSPYDDDQAEPVPPSPEPLDAPRTATWATRHRHGDVGNPAHAARVVAGLLGAFLRAAGWRLGRRGVELRQPTRAQLDGIAAPAGRIIGRYLPAELISGTLVDLAELAAACNDYALPGDDGRPLVQRIASVEYPGESL